MIDFAKNQLTFKTTIYIISCLTVGIATTNITYAEDTNQTSALLQQIDNYDQNQNISNFADLESLAQVNSVSQLRDVSPSDWAYEALSNLVTKYGCIAGYPDGTYKGQRALTRYEFAAGLNACLQSIERLVVGGGVDTSDLDSIRRLVQEFQAELTALGARVDNLEGRTAYLEDHNFSTTTKLEGEVLMAATGAAGDQVNDENIEGNITLGQKTRLNLITSFTGKDELVTRLQSEGAANPILNTPEGSLGFAVDASEASNNITLDALVYSFPIGDKTKVAIIANAGAHDDFANTINPLDGDGMEGALSAFGTRNPIYYQIEDKGFGIDHQFTDWLSLSLGYMATNANDPTAGNGLFNGPYGAIAQLRLTPNDNLQFALTYLNSYNESDTGTGSNRSNFQSFTENLFGTPVPTSSNSYGAEVSWRINPHIVLGGWAGYTNIQALSTLNGQLDRGGLDVWNWAATLTFPDLLKEGSTGAIIVGVEPYVTSSTVDIPGVDTEDQDTSLHIEALYQFALNDHIKITPGVIWLTAPDSDSNNDDVVIATVRTLFSF